jgi:predicted NAD/FAD-binding protein
MKKIAIIGSGISGLSAAYFLKDTHQVTIYEKNPQLGGHSRTIEVENTKVDTGFIVFNDRNYPNLMKLFQDLGLEIAKTQMSFSVATSKLEYAGNSICSIFAQKKNLFNYVMLRGLYDIYKFNKNAQKVSKLHPQLSLGELLEKIQMTNWFKHNYLLPMSGAIWSCPTTKMLDFPASSFVEFFANHGLLSLNNRPQWYSLKDKSIAYVSLLEKAIIARGIIIKNATITNINRAKGEVTISLANQPEVQYDELIFACHPQEILGLLSDISMDEKNILSKFSRQKNIAYTHSDISQMPKLKQCWSSWNYLASNEKVSVTYWMNQLQNIKTPLLFVTLNPNTKIDDNKIHDVYEFYHPVFDQHANLGKELIKTIQGKNNLWFTGAYLKNGFHEDGMLSSAEMIALLNNLKLIEVR